ncbi:MAG: type II toxin-antitoxin system RelE/ParE family toxin [Acidobacteriota bacterium]
MTWSVKIKRSAAKELRSIAEADRTRLIAAIDALAAEPYRGTALKGQLTGLRRIRVGVYRIIYEIRDGELVVLVVRVKHRRDVYGR